MLEAAVREAGSPEIRRYDREAAALFNNMRLPAAIIGGSILPLGFGFPLKTDLGGTMDSWTVAIATRVHHIVSIVSMLCELIAIVYSTVAVNKLTETVSPPTAGVMALLLQNYEKSWLGCNVNFLLGLMGLTVMIAVRAWLEFGVDFGTVPVLFTVAAVLLMVSIVNEGVAQGDGTGEGGTRFGKSFLGITGRYVGLLLHRACVKRSPMLFGTLACTLAGLVICALRLASESAL